MRTPMWSMAAILVFGLTANGQEPPKPERSDPSKSEKVERLKATEAYFRRAGKEQSAEFYRARAELTGKPSRIYVPVIKSDQLTRHEKLLLTELLIKGIERETTSKVVASPEEADLILETTLKPVPQSKP